MRETPRTISVPPSVYAWVEGRYEPENDILFRIFHDYRRTKGQIRDNCVTESGVRMKVIEELSQTNDLSLLVQHILAKMPVWVESSKEFKNRYGAVVEKIFFESEYVTEQDVLQKIWVLRNEFEHRNGIMVDVVPKNDEIADIYRSITDRLAGVFSVDEDETPTAPDLKCPEKKAAAM